jgi:type II secretory pathway component PulF
MHTLIAVQSAAAQAPHLAAVLGLNTGDPNQITEFFKAWSDAARKWMPFIVIFGCVLAYAALTLASRLGFEHLKNNIAGAFLVMMVIAIAPGLFA